MHVRTQATRAQEEGRVYAQLEDEHAALVRGLEALRFVLKRRVAGRPIPELGPLSARAQALAAVRDGAAQLLGAARQVQGLLSPESALVEYMRGALAWAHATLEALGALAQGIAAQSADVEGYNLRVELAQSLHFTELQGPILAELAGERRRGGWAGEAHACAERLFYAARTLEELL